MDNKQRMHEAIKALQDKGISQNELGKRLGLHRTAPAKWRQVPEQYLVQVAELSGLSMPFLRPDIFNSVREFQALMYRDGYAPGIRLGDL